MKTRYLERHIKADLCKKMVFVGGPRQTGKTTMAKALLADSQQGYLNWDNDQDRERILNKEFPNTPIWVFDELHKFKRWRGYLKGIYDKLDKQQQILVTGSARLDFYRFGGDSLQGRYHYWRLHPLSVAELGITTASEFEDLLTLGGFPEPYFSGSERDAKRWSREYRTRIIREDISALEQLHDLTSVELLAARLPSLVGSPLSINAIREDLQISHKTAANWLSILERLYHIFRIAPFGAPKIRAVKKETKLYHFNWTLIEDRAFRFENLVASHLLKWCHFVEDNEGDDMELRYFRDTDGREVDFVVLRNNRMEWMVECKLSDTGVSKSLKYLHQRFPEAKAVQVVCDSNKEFRTEDNILVQSPIKFLQNFV
jgi:predicted AAA+ superfamily ATPase